MVIGKGLVARNFTRYETLDDFLIFASGVSNSKSCTTEDLVRERTMFLSTVNSHPGKSFVYFSTTSIGDPDLQDTPYIVHKLEMERLIPLHTEKYHIFRLSNLAGRSENPNTLLNFFYSNIAHGHPFQLWKYSERNIIDVSDVFRTAHHIIQNGLFLNSAVNIANARNYTVKYIVDALEKHTGKKAVYTEKEKGNGFTIDIADVVPIYQTLGISFGENYLPWLLEKYYPQQ